MTVGELVELLSMVDGNKEIYTSCEGGCVVGNKIIILEQDNKVMLEI